MSLGGIVLVVSRVVVRIRREQIELDIKAQVAEVAGRRMSKVQDLAGLMAPSQNSVHNFKSRLMVIKHSFGKSVAQMKVVINEGRESRMRLKAKKREARQKRKDGIVERKSKVEKVRIEEGDSKLKKTIKAPRSAIRDGLKNWVSQINTVASRAGDIKQGWSERLKSYQEKREEKSKVATMKKVTEDLAIRIAEEVQEEGVKREPVKPSPAISISQNRAQGVPRKKQLVKKKDLYELNRKGIGKLFSKSEKTSPIKQAEAAFKKTDFDKVESILIPYLIKNPKDASAYMLLGRVALKRKAWDEAVEIFEQVVQIKPDTSECYSCLGKAVYESGNLTKAIEYLQKAHAAEPDNLYVLKSLYKIACHMDNQPLQRSLTDEIKQLEKS